MCYGLYKWPTPLTFHFRRARQPSFHFEGHAQLHCVAEDKALLHFISDGKTGLDQQLNWHSDCVAFYKNCTSPWTKTSPKNKAKQRSSLKKIKTLIILWFPSRLLHSRNINFKIINSFNNW